MKKRICLLLFMLSGIVTACGSSQKSRNPDSEPEYNRDMSVRPVPEAENPPETQTKAGALQNDAVSVQIRPAETNQERTGQEAEEMKMKIQVGNTVFTAALADNSSVDALKELLADGPLTLDMSDYADMEKGADLGVSLPQNNKQLTAQAGDIVLYQGRTFVIYYDTNSWSLTPLGQIDNADADSLRETLGAGDVTVTISLE